MFKKCKYILPVILGVTLVNSGYSMLASYHKKPFRGPVLSDKQVKSVLDSISVPESIKKNFSPLLQERRSFIIDQIDKNFGELRNSIILSIDGILELHPIEPELSEAELYEGAKNEQSKFTEQEREQNIALLSEIEANGILGDIPDNVLELAFKSAEKGNINTIKYLIKKNENVLLTDIHSFNSFKRFDGMSDGAIAVNYSLLNLFQYLLLNKQYEIAKYLMNSQRLKDACSAKNISVCNYALYNLLDRNVINYVFANDNNVRPLSETNGIGSLIDQSTIEFARYVIIHHGPFDITWNQAGKNLLHLLAQKHSEYPEALDVELLKVYREHSDPERFKEAINARLVNATPLTPLHTLFDCTDDLRRRQRKGSLRRIDPNFVIFMLNNGANESLNFEVPERAPQGRVLEIADSKLMRDNYYTKENEELIKLLLSYGANPIVTDRKDVQERLDQYVAENNFPITPVYTDIWDAAQNGDLQFVQNFIGNVNVVDRNGFTPLHNASWNGHLSIVECLISKGAKINNAKDDDGCTPLHMALYKKHLDIADLLISKGADINAKDNDGLTPISILNSDVLSNWKTIAVCERYNKDLPPLITTAIEGNIDFWNNWHAQITDEELLKEWLRYGLFIAAANGQSQFFNNIYMLLTQYDSNIDLSLIKGKARGSLNVIDIALYSLNPEIIGEIRVVDETVFNNYLNKDVSKISSRLTTLFLDRYGNLVREINNPRDDTNMNKLIEEMNDLIGKYIHICRYLANNFDNYMATILKFLERDIKKIDTTSLTGELEKYKTENIYNSINSFIKN